jgi:4-cresol dehydrogenase (hydroxylating)
MLQPEFGAACSEWTEAIGAEFVVRSPEKLHQAATATFATASAVPAILRPGSRDEVQECVRIANRHRTRLYPISSGKNWGYGSRVPSSDNCVVLDLGRMDRIVEFREDLAYVTVEPGVTQQQLFDFLRAQKSRLWMDATGASPECSIIGNTMERGFGHTPYGDHFASACAFEVVLPTGECITTGFGNLPDAKAAAVYRWGAGPVLDGLFTQSNLGIVTRMTVWLMPAPEYTQVFFFQCAGEQDLGPLIDALRPLRLNGTLRSSVHIGNDYKVLNGLGQGDTPLSPEKMREIRSEMSFGRWNGSGGIYGTRVQVNEARRLLKIALKGKVTRLQFLDDRLLARAARFARPYRWATGLDLRRTLEIIDPDPDRDGCGLLWCAPVAPAEGKPVEAMTGLAENVLLSHGFEPMISLTLTTDRAVTCVISISYDRAIAGEDDRAMRCYQELLGRMTEAGFYSYRLGIQAPPLFDPQSDYGRLLAKLKIALDPHEILAPGPYLPPVVVAQPQVDSMQDTAPAAARVTTELRVSHKEVTPPTLHQLSRNLVRDLHAPRAKVYWTDYLLTSCLGWSAFALAVYYPFLSAPMLLAMATAVFALYRGLLFVHEISHFIRGRMRGFEIVWNLLSGFPILLPAFVYSGMHLDHHRISLYGTEFDPEYLPFAHSRRMTTFFSIESLFIPILLVMRFLVLAPFGLLIPRLHRWLATHASSLVINFKYRRDLSNRLEHKMRSSELAILLLWGGAILSAWEGLLPWRTFAVWAMVVSLISFVNTVRTLVAHAYDSSGEPMDRTAQLLDSIDHPGGWWTELWAPVGLRYHALHHYFPGIPYHNLGIAYRRLMTQLPSSSEYQRSTNSSFRHSLRELYRKAAARSVAGSAVRVD